MEGWGDGGRLRLAFELPPPLSVPLCLRETPRAPPRASWRHRRARVRSFVGLSQRHGGTEGWRHGGIGRGCLLAFELPSPLSVPLCLRETPRARWSHRRGRVRSFVGLSQRHGGTEGWRHGGMGGGCGWRLNCPRPSLCHCASVRLLAGSSKFAAAPALRGCRNRRLRRPRCQLLSGRLAFGVLLNVSIREFPPCGSLRIFPSAQAC
jgi:hypothetical protein